MTLEMSGIYRNEAKWTACKYRTLVDRLVSRGGLSNSSAIATYVYQNPRIQQVDIMVGAMEWQLINGTRGEGQNDPRGMGLELESSV